MLVQLIGGASGTIIIQTIIPYSQKLLRGKLSQIHPKNNDFHGFNFHELLFGHFVLYYLQFREFYFCESQKIVKRAKVIGLESFQLYGNVCITNLSKLT